MPVVISLDEATKTADVRVRNMDVAQILADTSAEKIPNAAERDKQRKLLIAHKGMEEIGLARKAIRHSDAEIDAQAEAARQEVLRLKQARPT